MNEVINMENLKIEVIGNKVVITILDISQESGLSASGKSRNVASTRGNVLIPGTSGLTIGLNAYRKA